MSPPSLYAIGGGLYPRRRSQPPKDQNKNVLSGVVSVVVVVIVCACVSQPQWIWLKGGGCTTHNLGLYLFFHPGHFQPTEGTHYGLTTPHLIYYTNGQELKFCVTPEIVSLMRMVIVLIFLLISTALMQMLLDMNGPSSAFLKALQRNAIPSIFSVLLCVVSVGLCYYITTLVENQQEATKPVIGPNASARVQVKMDIGFYLLIFAGGMSVLAVGCNWLRPSHIFHDDTAPLVEGEWGGHDSLENYYSRGGAASSLPHLPHIPYMPHDMEPPPPMEGHPPPPYTP